MHFKFATITVTDMDESLAFYRKVLGLELKEKISPKEGMTIAFLTDDRGGALELIGYDKIYEGEAQNQRVSLAYEVEDLKECISRLAVDGIEIKRGPVEAEGGVRFLFIEDPSGIEIELIEGFSLE